MNRTFSFEIAKIVVSIIIPEQGRKKHQKSGVQNMTEESITEAIHTLFSSEGYFLALRKSLIKQSLKSEERKL